MRQKRKQEIEQYFRAPTPKQKRSFLRANRQNQISIWRMVMLQMVYLSKRAWCIFFAILMITLFLIKWYLASALGMFFSMLPFWSMFILTETMRSMIYRMDELEMTARFSLKSVIIARMGILGAGSLIIIVLLALALGNGVWRNICYLLVPYLITASGGLVIIRKFPTKEGTYLCGAFASIVSLIAFTGVEKYKWIFEAGYLFIWILIIGALLYITVREGYRTIRMTEDMIWN